MEDKIEICGQDLRLVLQPGVFAKNGVDYGSRLLLEVLRGRQMIEDGGRDRRQKGDFRILDLGCGCGVLGLSLASCLPSSKVYMVDADIRAVRNSRLNAKLNEIKNVEIGIGDWGDNLPKDLKFDLVVSNPPTHQGREVIEKFIESSFNVLNSDGELWVVMNRMTSVIKQLESVFDEVERVKNKKGYMVVRSVKR